jgi:phosphoglycolate phosphatase
MESRSSSELNKGSFSSILFDLDGTLLDTGPSILSCLRLALNSYGVDYRNVDLEQFVGPPLMPMLEKVFGFSEKKASNVVDAFRKEYVKDGQYLQCRFYPDIKEALTKLKSRGVDLYVATSKPDLLMRPMLEHFGFLSFFLDVQGSDAEKALVSKSQILSYLIIKHGINKAEALMVGDTKFDVLGAKEAGIFSCGVLYGYGRKAELVESGVDMLVSNPLDLLSFQ